MMHMNEFPWSTFFIAMGVAMVVSLVLQLLLRRRQ